MQNYEQRPGGEYLCRLLKLLYEKVFPNHKAEKKGDTANNQEQIRINANKSPIMATRPVRSRTGVSLRTPKKDKELIKNGLNRLASHVQAGGRLASKSNIIPPMEHPTTEDTTANNHNSNNSSKIPVPISGDQDTRPSTTSRITPTQEAFTMTDYDASKERKLGSLLSASVHNYPPRNLEWTDPRLVRKYSLFKKPSYRKSVTIPRSPRSQVLSEDDLTKASEGDMELPVKKEESDFEDQVFYTDEGSLIFRAMYRICKSSSLFVGTMCGITLITVIASKLLEENIIDFPFYPPKDEMFLKKYASLLLSGLANGVGSVFQAIFRFLTIPTSEVFERKEETTWSFSLV